MLESLNYSFRNPKKHNLSNLPHQTVEKLQKNHGVLREPQLGKQRWRARLRILRVNSDIKFAPAAPDSRNRQVSCRTLMYFRSVCEIAESYCCGLSVCLSAGKTGLPLDGFERNLVIKGFLKKNMARKFNFNWNLTIITGTLHEHRYTFFIISLSFLLRMRNVSDKSCTENQNTHFVFSNFFLKIVPFMR